MNVHFSSKSNEWETPQDFFNTLDKEFGFTLDVCATKNNSKCSQYFTKEHDGLSQSWDHELVWCNPPYGREIGKWVKKASEAMGGGSRDVNTGKNRHKILSRIYLPERGRRDTLYKRSSQIWWTSELRTFSFYGCNF